MTPIIGAMLQYQSKWEICSDSVPIFGFLVKHKGKNRSTKNNSQFTLIFQVFMSRFVSTITHLLRSGSDFLTLSHLDRFPYRLTKGPDQLLRESANKRLVLIDLSVRKLSQLPSPDKVLNTCRVSLYVVNSVCLLVHPKFAAF